MKIKYRSGYAEGGFLDDGASVDPVSGNEVPTGSLAEEVRDDVPAQLSEGEFVVPADVVRFIGLDKLMKMRNAAKAGLADMEAEGQVGGQPAPMQPQMDEDMEMDALIDGMDSEGFDGAVQAFAVGGSVMPAYNSYSASNAQPSTSTTSSTIPSYDTYTGRKFNDPDIVEHVKYTNAAGDIINVAHVRGKPVGPVPDGYWMVGSKEEEKGSGGSGGSAATSTVNSGPSDAVERDQNHKNSQEYKNQVIKSSSIQRVRNNVLNTMHKDNMTAEEVDTFYASLTPMAQAEYESRFRNPSGIDKFMAGKKSPVEMMIIAQKTVNSRNNKNGVFEPNSRHTSTGEPLDFEKYKEAFVNTIEGMSLLKTLGKDGFVKKLSAMFGDAAESFIQPDIVGNTTQPTEIQAPQQVINQAHWKNRMGELAKAGLDPSAIQAKLAQEQREVMLNKGRTVNQYGHKIQNPGMYTIWDQIADVQTNKVAAIQANLDRVNGVTRDSEGNVIQGLDGTVASEDPSAESTAFAANASEDPSAESTAFETNASGDPSAESTAFETSVSQDPAEEATVSFDSQITPIEDNVLRNQMLQSETEPDGAVDYVKALLDQTDSANQFFSEVSPPRGDEGQYLIDSSFGEGDYQQDVLDQTASADAFFAEQEQKIGGNISSSEVEAQEVAQLEYDAAVAEQLASNAGLGTTGVLGETAATATPQENMQIDNEKQIRVVAKEHGLNPELMINAWNASGETSVRNFVEAQVAEKRNEDSNIRLQQARGDQVSAKSYADKLAADRAAYLASQNKPKPAQQNSGREDYRTKPTPKPTLPNTPPPGRGGNNNDNYTYSPPTPSKKEKEEQASDYDKMYGNAGGLATKKKPSVKKMRNDPTAGLASKKKAKQKAQAKKGALAAKRT